jgi:hypothetical protein
MINVNHDMVDTETEVCLALAKLYDEGFPSIPHAHPETSLIHPSLTYGISEKCDSTPKECAASDAPVEVENRRSELQDEVH